MKSTEGTADGSFAVENNQPVHDAPVNSIPDGGLLAWLQVAGSFCLYFCTWGNVPVLRVSLPQTIR